MQGGKIRTVALIIPVGMVAACHSTQGWPIVNTWGDVFRAGALLYLKP